MTFYFSKGKITAVFLCFFIVSCINIDKNSNSFSVPVKRELAWKAMVQTLKPYPLKTIDEKTGYMETKEMKGSKFWKAPHQKDQNFYGYSYTLKAHLKYQAPLSHITIQKKLYKQKGFLSEKKEVPSDYLEESVLIYEIIREIEWLKRKSSR